MEHFRHKYARIEECLLCCSGSGQGSFSLWTNNCIRGPGGKVFLTRLGGGKKHRGFDPGTRHIRSGSIFFRFKALPRAVEFSAENSTWIVVLNFQARIANINYKVQYTRYSIAPSPSTHTHKKFVIAKTNYNDFFLFIYLVSHNLYIFVSHSYDFHIYTLVFFHPKIYYTDWFQIPARYFLIHCRSHFFSF